MIELPEDSDYPDRTIIFSLAENMPRKMKKRGKIYFASLEKHASRLVIPKTGDFRARCPGSP
jgi:hypothetical protein